MQSVYATVRLDVPDTPSGSVYFTQGRKGESAKAMIHGNGTLRGSKGAIGRPAPCFVQGFERSPRTVWRRKALPGNQC